MIINLISVEKQSRPGNVRGYLRIKNFLLDPLLCPCAAIIEYNSKVSFYFADNLDIESNFIFLRLLTCLLIDQHFLLLTESLTIMPRHKHYQGGPTTC